MTTIDEQIAKSMVQEKFERCSLTKFLLVTKKYTKAILQLRNIRDEYGNDYIAPLKLTKEFVDSIRYDYAVLEPLDVALILQGNSEYVLRNKAPTELQRKQYQKSIEVVQLFFGIFNYKSQPAENYQS